MAYPSVGFLKFGLVGEVKMTDLEILDSSTRETVIKVIGVGGAGGNAIAHMIRSGLKGVDFICANTDSQALIGTKAPVQIRLGQTGLGAGAKPDQGRSCAEAAREDIRSSLTGANMVFITAGMGGGTGTGAAPVVAEVAKELGVLTVGVVTKPFSFEGSKRLRIAEEGILELSKHVHSLIVVLNENLYELLDEDATQEDCFKSADDVLHNACAGIAEIINVEGNVNVDFEDVRTIMGERGKAMMGTAVAEGEGRARIAAEEAISSPLLEGIDLNGAKGILVNVTSNRSLKMRETREIMEIVQGYAAEDATVIFGNAYDETMESRLRVTVVATGLGSNQIEQSNSVKNIDGNSQILHDTHDMRTSDQNVNLEEVYETSKEKMVERVRALEISGMEHFDIPSFLRKQVD